MQCSAGGVVHVGAMLISYAWYPIMQLGVSCIIETVCSVADLSLLRSQSCSQPMHGSPAWTGRELGDDQTSVQLLCTYTVSYNSSLASQHCTHMYLFHNSLRIESDSLPHTPTLPPPSFDIAHYGHANALRQAKKMGSHVIVGVHSDGELNQRVSINHPGTKFLEAGDVA